MINRDNRQIRLRVGDHIAGSGLDLLEVKTPGPLVEDEDIPLLEKVDVLPHQKWIVAPFLYRDGSEQPKKNPEIPASKIILLGREIYRLAGGVGKKRGEEGRDRDQKGVIHRKMVGYIEDILSLLRNILLPPDHSKVEWEAKEDKRNKPGCYQSNIRDPDSNPI